ncbi:glycosyltransferase involved in cell wall biosynthesis [Luteimonas cucumeris]|uniref:Glycosyltransferase involved in cell wall biosynthesis n=1 Tax=Luteimonas cucumeris TaxID=985012 RepID=A0A562L5N3_9GAMM|nr:glycosyltransferase [Luteimonas cucumeris]TWI02982.1 glycosyltransferase involved in cell wall biosynthesis [Luteimonas cucumeris]
MRILIVAYDFPPTPSPQAIRWAYLSRELVLAGHEVHVLAPDVAGYGPGGLPELPDSISVHRVYPGPFMAFLSSRSRSKMSAQSTTSAAHSDPDRTMGLNWKGRWVERFKTLLAFLMFPDVRAEWLPWARKSLDELLRRLVPDVVVTSHEPANSIPLGLRAKAKGFRWVADLGDPILAPYTPFRWRSRARKLEAQVCRHADAITVTNSPVARLLQERHGIPSGELIVLPQGYDQSFEANVEDRIDVDLDKGLVELLYTGSFYHFRNPAHLLAAVRDSVGIRLNIASHTLPDEVRDAATAHPGKIRLLGFVPHRSVLELQRRCDLLINIANDDPVQVPGKVYEYLGSGVPILHIGGTRSDDAARLLVSSGAGWCVENAYPQLRERLTLLAQAKSGPVGIARGPCERSFDVTTYSWKALAAQLTDQALLAPVDARRFG